MRGRAGNESEAKEGKELMGKVDNIKTLGHVSRDRLQDRCAHQAYKT